MINAQGYMLMQLITSFWIPQIIYSAIQLGMIDKLSLSPTSLKELCGTSTKRLRLLNGLESLGIVERSVEQLYSLTTLGENLSKDKPGSLYDYAKMTGDRFYAAWGELHQVLDSSDDTSGFEKAWNSSLYEEMNDSFISNFGNAMDNFSIEFEVELEKHIEVKNKNVLDLGGGTGKIASLFAKKAQRVDVLDIEAYEPSYRAKDKDNISFLTGSFLDSVPPGYDVHLFVRVLHNWSDKNAAQILNHSANELNTNGRIYIVDNLATDERIQPLLDLNMLVLTGGKYRQLEDYKILLKSIHLEVVHHTLIGQSYILIEVRKATN